MGNSRAIGAGLRSHCRHLDRREWAAYTPAASYQGQRRSAVYPPPPARPRAATNPQWCVCWGRGRDGPHWNSREPSRGLVVSWILDESGGSWGVVGSVNVWPLTTLGSVATHYDGWRGSADGVCPVCRGDPLASRPYTPLVFCIAADQPCRAVDVCHYLSPNWLSWPPVVEAPAPVVSPFRRATARDRLACVRRRRQCSLNGSLRPVIYCCGVIVRG